MLLSTLVEYAYVLRSRVARIDHGLVCDAPRYLVISLKILRNLDAHSKITT